MGHTTIEPTRPCDRCVIRIAKMDLNFRGEHIAWACWDCAEHLVTLLATTGEYAKQFPIEAAQGLERFKEHIARLRREELN